MVAARPELTGLDPFVDASKHVTVNITAIVDTAKVPYEVVQRHSRLRLQVGSVQVRVQHYYRERQHKDLGIKDNSINHFITVIINFTYTKIK